MSAAGRLCGPKFFPPPRWNQVPVAAVRDACLKGFSRWGRPLRIRVDNGSPWGSTGDWPTALALWWIGWGIEVIWNPPRQPQKNGVVERAQGTGKRWAEPHTCHSAPELQRRIHRLDHLQRDEYPLADGLTRRERFPALHMPHPDAPANWDFSRVLQHLAGYHIERQVNACGQVSIYSRNLYVGLKYQKKNVWVLFDPESAEWIFTDLKGHELKRHHSRITSRAVTSFPITHRPKIPAKSHREQENRRGTT